MPEIQPLPCHTVDVTSYSNSGDMTPKCNISDENPTRLLKINEARVVGMRKQRLLPLWPV